MTQPTDWLPSYQCTDWVNQQLRWSCRCNQLSDCLIKRLPQMTDWLTRCLTDCVISESLCVYKAAIATATLSVWLTSLPGNCLCSSRGRERTVSTEQRRQLLIFYLSIIFVFRREKASERSMCVCVCMRVSVSLYVWCRCVYMWACCLYVAHYLLTGVNQGQCVYTVGSMLLPCEVDSWPTRQSIDCPHCSLIG